VSRTDERERLRNLVDAAGSSMLSLGGPYQEILSKVLDEHEKMMTALWECYVLCGEDTDGNTRWHCPPAEAAEYTINAVRELRADYDVAMTENAGEVA
jgi:hypothetical protein